MTPLIGEPIRHFKTTEPGEITAVTDCYLTVCFSAGTSNRIDLNRVRRIGKARYIDAPADLGVALVSKAKKRGPKSRVDKGNRMQKEAAKLGCSVEELRQRMKDCGLSEADYFSHSSDEVEIA